MEASTLGTPSKRIKVYFHYGCALRCVAFERGEDILWEEY